MACRSRASGLGATDLAATRCEILGEDLNAEDSRSMVVHFVLSAETCFSERPEILNAINPRPPCGEGVLVPEV